MKNLFLILSFAAFVTSGCLKSDTNCGASTAVAPAAEGAAVQAYLTANSINAIKHSSNIYYEIISAGTGTASPTICSNVMINYSGKLTNGTVFDSNNGSIFQLSGLIEGWKIGLPLIKKGGQIRLYIPPSLGYGPSANGPIPANSILIFDITLVDFQ